MRTLSLGRILRNQLRKYLAKSAVEGVYVDDIGITVHLAEDGYRLDVAYTLGSDVQLEYGSILFEMTAVPLVLEAVHCTDNLLPDEVYPTGKSIDPILIFRIAPGSTFEGAKVRFTFHWPLGTQHSGSRISRCLVVPDLLPSLLGSNERRVRLQPAIRVAGASQKTGLLVAGFLANESSRGDPTAATMLQAAITTADNVSTELARTGFLRIYATDALIRGLSPGERQRIGNLAARMLEFLATRFGKEPRGRVLIATNEDVRTLGFVPEGTFVASTPTAFGLGRRMGLPFDVWLASEYAAIWWGTGCKIIGPGAAELSIGITTAMGLLWTKYIGETEIVERTLEIFRGHLRGSLIRDWWESAQGKPRSALMFGTTLSIYDRLQHEGEALEAIQALTRANWGKYVWSTDVAARLAEVGVNLPKPFRRL